MKWLVVFLILIMGVLIPADIVLAGTSVDVTLWATPIISGGINNFVITYVNDTRLDMTWGYSTNTTAIMIRGKYGRYPADIPDKFTAPTDGYLVYTGNGTSTSDTSMDFDQNPGPIYYKAWGQLNDGTWHTPASSGWKESAVMTLIGLFIFCGILTFAGVRSSYYLLKFLAGGSWLLLMAYWVASPPSTMSAGDPAHTIGLILFIGMAVAMFFMPMWYTKSINGNEEGSFNIRIPKIFGGRSEDEESQERRFRAMTSRDRQANYKRRLP